jgi:hypothetical protein
MLSHQWVAEQEKLSTIAYHQFPDTTVTIALVTLPNGFSLIGHSACINQGHFDPIIGEQVALQEAMRELWALEGYHRKANL